MHYIGGGGFIDLYVELEWLCISGGGGDLECAMTIGVNGKIDRVLVRLLVMFSGSLIIMDSTTIAVPAAPEILRGGTRYSKCHGSIIRRGSSSRPPSMVVMATATSSTVKSTKIIR